MRLPSYKQELSSDQFRTISRLRHDDAKSLRKSARFNGSVYMAGYAVECMLKSIICKTTRPPGIHELDKLLHLSVEAKKEVEKHGIHESFARVAQWSVHLRYQTKPLRREDVDEFLERTKEVLECLAPLSK